MNNEKELNAAADEKDECGYDCQSEEYQNWKNCVLSAMKHADKLFDRAEAKGLPTGFKYLDDQLGCLRRGQLITISSRPASGNRVLARDMVECIAGGQNINGMPMMAGHDHKHVVLIFSLATSSKTWASQMIFSRGGVSKWRLERGLYCHELRVQASEWLVRAADHIMSLPIIVDDTGGLDIGSLESRARDMKCKHGIELIMIDNLQLLSCNDVQDSGREYELGEISTRLRDLARELDVPIILVSQLRDATYSENDLEFHPLESRVWEMGIAERLSDVVLLVRRPCLARGHSVCYDELLAIVDVVKNRDGETGRVEMNYYRQGPRFGDRRQAWPPHGDDDDTQPWDDEGSRQDCDFVPFDGPIMI